MGAKALSNPSSIQDVCPMNLVYAGCLSFEPSLMALAPTTHIFKSGRREIHEYRPVILQPGHSTTELRLTTWKLTLQPVLLVVRRGKLTSQKR